MRGIFVLLALCVGCLSIEPCQRCYAPYKAAYPTNNRHRTMGHYGPHLTSSSSEESSEANGGPMKTLYSWKQIDFVFPNSGMRKQLIDSQQFIPINTLILDVDIYQTGASRKIFLTLPRARPGVPVTLATVSGQTRDGENLLEPFPNWDANNAFNRGSCDGITSVFRVHIDECGRLWVLDSGSINMFTSNPSIPCPPKIWIYDLRNSNRLIGVFPMPESVTEDNSLLVTIAVDIRRGQCSDAFAYIADAIAYKMIVFDLRSQQFWRVNSIQFQAYPDQSRFVVNGDSFDLFGGVFGLAMGPVYGKDRRLLYFHSIDSVKQSWVDTADLRNQTLWRSSMNAKPRAFNLFNGSRPSQSTADVMSDQGIMFFGLVGSNEVACWNTETRFGGENIVRLAKNDVTLQVVSGIKLSEGKLYTVTGRLQRFLNNKVDPAEVNYRVLEGDVRQMTRGTKCEVPDQRDRLRNEYDPHLEGVEEPADVELTKWNTVCSKHSLVCLH